MKLTSALTLTTFVSILSSTHAFPLSLKPATLEANPEHPHLRRDSTISDIAGSDLSSAHDSILEGLEAAFEPGNSIKQLFSMVKRQLGSTDTSSNTASPSGGATTSDAPSTGTSTTQSNAPANDITHAVTELMGGDLDSASSAGFSFEPENTIPNIKSLKV
ncbi:hypothetical protein P7C71_g399, partial [Lecanoromycetidae sp. Uapishka_2]